MDSDFVTIVSGLPRSGTSMMMQVLEKGGMSVLTDNIRKKNEDNPKGYYEFEPVKKTKTNPSWLPDAVGKAVKIVYKLLYDLPQGYKYRVIFIKRNIEEILLSQRLMLERSDQKGASISDNKLAQLFEKELEKIDKWLESRGDFSVSYVNYNKMIESPEPHCRTINEFLGGVLDINKMLSAIDPSLYRNRK